MLRRDFLRTGVLFAGGAGAVGGAMRAMARDSSADALSQAFPGLIHSARFPGEWKGKERGHIPVVTLHGLYATVETRHGMSPRHYIVRHTILRPESGTVIAAHTYDPEMDTQARTTFLLPPQCCSETLVATSFCNRHDLWVSAFVVPEASGD